MTRHGMTAPHAPGAPPLATAPCASMIIVGAKRAASKLASLRQRRPTGPPCAPTASIPALPHNCRAIPRTGRKQKSP